MVTLLFIHSAGAQGPGEGSDAFLSALRPMLPPEIRLLAPFMPEPEAPKAQSWAAAIAAQIRAIDGDFILLGHSLGGSAILQVLARAGVPQNLLGVVTLAAPFWGAPDWAYDEYALPADAGEKLGGRFALRILHGADDDVVAGDHPERYKNILPQARIHILLGIDHQAANAGLEVLEALNAITAL